MVTNMILCVRANEMPRDVIEYCVENEISTHYQNDVALVANDDNPFAKWIKEEGYLFRRDTFDYVGIIAT